jgi:hypothetical protein
MSTILQNKTVDNDNNLGATTMESATVTDLCVDDGAESTPSIKFTSDPDTGLYSDGAGSVAFSTNGTKRFKLGDTVAELSTDLCGPSDFTIENGINERIEINQTGAQLNFVTDNNTRAQVLSGSLTTTVPVRTSAGTAAAPTHSFSGDNDTGLYSVGPNNLGISVGTSKEVDINSTRVDFTSGISINGGTVMDTYSEGTWTPTMGDGTNEVTYSTQNGVYTRIGNRVFVHGLVNWTALGSVSGTIRLSLPFTASPITDVNIFTVWTEDITSPANDIVGYLPGGGNDYFEMIARNATDGIVIDNLDLGSAGAVAWNGHYSV